MNRKVFPTVARGGANYNWLEIYMNRKVFPTTWAMLQSTYPLEIHMNRELIALKINCWHMNRKVFITTLYTNRVLHSWNFH